MLYKYTIYNYKPCIYSIYVLSIHEHIIKWLIKKGSPFSGDKFNI